MTRLQIFFKNTKAKFSFLTICIVYMMSLCANFIANDRPIIVYYKGKLYCPIYHDYSSDVFEGEPGIVADFSDPKIHENIKAHGWTIKPLIPYGDGSIDDTQCALSPPSPRHFLGTDDQGRDVFVRLLYGIRTSLTFGIILVVITSLISLCIGAMQGYFGGTVDLWIQRFIEIWGSLPILYILMLLSCFFAPHFAWLVVVVSFFYWMPLANLVRLEFLRIRAMDYIKACEVLGATPSRIMRKHILPNAMICILTYTPFLMNQAIVILASLDFLGFGLPLGSPSIGDLITQSKNNVHAPWLGMTTFLTMACILSALTFIGEGIREAFSPQQVNT